MKLKSLGLILLSCIALSGCAVVDWMTYKLPIRQGNIVEQKDVDLLRSGMTPEQVVFVLGEPLARSSFKGTRWEYSFKAEHGREVLADTRFVVFFEQGLLAAAGGQFDLPEGLEKRDI